jgi:hypothetical protein
LILTLFLFLFSKYKNIRLPFHCGIGSFCLCFDSFNFEFGFLSVQMFIWHLHRHVECVEVPITQAYPSAPNADSAQRLSRPLPTATAINAKGVVRLCMRWNVLESREPRFTRVVSNAPSAIGLLVTRPFVFPKGSITVVVLGCALSNSFVSKVFWFLILLKLIWNHQPQLTQQKQKQGIALFFFKKKIVD